MHDIAIATKRAHLRTTHHLRHYAAAFGLTPARYDLMFAISQMALCYQDRLWRKFHVSRATISRMLGSLEKLGLLRRTRNRKRGSRWVELTAKGRRVIRDAARACQRSLCRLFEELFGPRKRLYHYAVEVEDLEQSILGVATFFGDRSFYHYGYGHPDD